MNKIEIPFGYCHCGCGHKAPIAKRTYSHRGVRAGDPFRFIAGHASRVRYSERFWDKVDIGEPDACWEWNASRFANGYGHFHKSVSERHALAHRVAYELAHSPIPDGMYILHQCDNPACCNPAHLSIGTQADNMRGAMDRGRVHNGEAVSASILTERDVRAIRDRYVPYVVTAQMLAPEYGVSDSAIYAIIHGRNWRHV